MVGLIETTKMSSRGQVVIPQDVREAVNADEGTVFAVVGSGDTILLKKVMMPSKEDALKWIAAFSKESRKRLEAAGIKESDIPEIVHRRRRLNANRV